MTKYNAYEVLGIEADASVDDIKAAYAELSKKYHPEEKPEDFQRIHEAYVTLTRQTRNPNRMTGHVSVMPNIDIKTSISESVVEEENQENSFNFSNIDEAKQEDYERRLQSAIKQLDGVMYIDKNLDNVLLKKILNSKEREFIYSEEFIKKLIILLQDALVDRETVKIVKKYLRPWDITLEDKREVLDKLKCVLEERKEFYFKHTQKVANSIYTWILLCLIGIMLLVCLVTNFWAVIKTIFVLSLIGGIMYLVYKLCRRNGTEWYAYMVSFFSGLVVVLLSYLFEVWKWIINNEFVKLLNEMLIPLFVLLTIVAFSEWKRGK